MNTELERNDLSGLKELSWEKRPVSELIRLAWPIAVSMLSYSVMTLVDTILVGHVGRAPLAGVGLAGVASFLLLSFSIGMFRAANTLVAQAVGGAFKIEPLPEGGGTRLTVRLAP